MAEYLAQIPQARSKDVRTLHAFIKTTVPKLKSFFAYNMLGYGAFPYENYKKETIPWPVIALANQKNYISLYICAMEEGIYIAEKYKSMLGKVSVGKSCVRFKKMEDVNLPALAKVLRIAAKKPGLVATKQPTATQRKVFKHP